MFGIIEDNFIMKLKACNILTLLQIAVKHLHKLQLFAELLTVS